jgi:LuxR family maltose regulon positive regulatory protein
MRVYFAQRRWMEAVEWLERWQTHLDRATNITITITFLAQSLVALHQTGRSEHARRVAARLLALTEPEGYLRVYLDEGEPMREALLALLIPHSQQHELSSSTTAYLSKLLTAFEQEQSGANTSLVVASTSEPAPSLVRQASTLSSAPGTSLTRREQEVLRLLAAGASNQDIAQTLVIELGVSSRTQAIALARTRSLL